MDAETARLHALRGYRILDTEPEKAFDDLALLASEICGTPMALISLVDADRRWFKARVGVTARPACRLNMVMPADTADGREIQMRKRGGGPEPPPAAGGGLG